MATAKAKAVSMVAVALMTVVLEEMQGAYERITITTRLWGRRCLSHPKVDCGCRLCFFITNSYNIIIILIKSELCISSSITYTDFNICPVTYEHRIVQVTLFKVPKDETSYY